MDIKETKTIQTILDLSKQDNEIVFLLKQLRNKVGCKELNTKEIAQEYNISNNTKLTELIGLILEVNKTI